MKTAIILHGMPDKDEYYNSERSSQSNSHWIPWIQRQLILKDILAQTPEMPEPYRPDYEKWCSVFDQFCLDENTTLVGHSCGGGFLVRWLSENKVKVGKVILVAPWIDPDKTDTVDFFDFDIDPAITDRVKGLTIIVSDKDYQDIHTSVEQITKAISGTEVIAVPGKGHFVFKDMGTEAFPELLTACLS